MFSCVYYIIDDDDDNDDDDGGDDDDNCDRRCCETALSLCFQPSDHNNGFSVRCRCQRLSIISGSPADLGAVGC